MKCEILLTGNELLIGKTLDSNGIWTIQQLTPLGVRITQLTMIQDDLQEIAAAIKASLARNPEYLLISGGLGPTFDDMTFKGIQLGLTGNSDVILDLQAQEWIFERYHKRFPNYDVSQLLERYPYIRKMASFPIGTKPLRNLAGTAPGAYIPSDNFPHQTIIISMPGIPEEYQNMFSTYVIPEIKEKMKNENYLECGMVFQNLPESGFANKIYEIKDLYPSLWFKTHPHRSPDHHWLIELHISSFSHDPQDFLDMEKIYLELKDFIQQKGGILMTTHPPINPSEKIN